MASQEELKKRLKALMNRPENQICSDCPERQPRWASLIVPPPGAPPGTQPIGAFCCLECSGSHRRLGVHISFVRSVNLDSWKEKEVLAMENGGNRKVNAIFEARMPPDLVKPQSGADGPTRERFIRDKYERRRFYDPAGFDNYATGQQEYDEPDDDVRSRYSNSGRSTRTTPPIRPPSDAARQRVENRQAAQAQARIGLERKGSERSKIPKAPKSAPASFDLLDLSAPPTTMAPAMDTNFLPPTSKPVETLQATESTSAARNMYAADLLAPMQPQSNSSSNNGNNKNSHDHIMALFNSPPPQQAMMGGMNPSGDFNPMMLNQSIIMPQQQQQQHQSPMMNIMVQPRSNMMVMMQQQQQQQQQMLHQRMMQGQEQQQQQSAGFGTNVMVQPKGTPQEQAMQSFQQSFHHSYIWNNDGGGGSGYDNGYGNNMGYGNQQPNNSFNMMAQQQQQQQQQRHPGMMMTSASMHGGGSGGGMSSSSMMMNRHSQDDGSGFPSTPMGGNVMLTSSGPLVSSMHRPPMQQQSPQQSSSSSSPPRKDDPFAQFGMNVFRS